MGKVKTLNLKEGTRIGNYRIIEKIGRGWEGEVYAVQEIPTESKRAMKIIAPTEIKQPVRYVTHVARTFEQIAPSHSVARYYHMGQWFFDDNEGHFYLVFERLKGPTLCEYLSEKKTLSEKHALRLIRQSAEAISRIHELGFAVGDFEYGENMIVTGNADDPRPVFCDFNPGEPDYPNEDFQNDVKELFTLSKFILEGVPSSSKTKAALKLLKMASKEPPNDNETIRKLTQEMREW